MTSTSWLPELRRAARLVLLLLPLLPMLTAGPGCASSAKSQPKPTPIGEPQTQSLLMTMSDDLMYAVADACAQINGRTKRDDTRTKCASIRLGTAIGAISAATSQNARVGMADLVTLAALQRMALEDPRTAAAFDEADRRLLHDTFAKREQAMLERVRKHVTEQQISELYELINAWRAANPERLGMTQVRLEEFALVRQAPIGSNKNADVSASSILRLLRIDPMQGLDPATREIYQSRLLAERVAFWGQRIPLILGWQMELTTARVLGTGGVKEVIDNSSKFTQATGEFSQATTRMAASYERTLAELPKERAAAIEQADRAVDARVKAAIEQSSAAVASERKAAIEQVGGEMSKRLDALVERLNRDVDAQSNRTLDHAAGLVAAERGQMLSGAEASSRRLVDRMATLLLVVIAAGAVVIACVVLAFRRLATRVDRLDAAPPRDDSADAGTPIKLPAPDPRHA